jgi:3-oxoacyl-[acyl-carrier protein] reductase
MAFSGKVALITGGSKGIGRAAAEQLAAQGALVAINYSSDSKAADEVVAALGGAEKALAIKADAGSMSDVKSMVEQTVAKFGKIDILVPNAGLMPLANLESLTEELFDKMNAVNVKGPLFLAKVGFPPLFRLCTSIY